MTKKDAPSGDTTNNFGPNLKWDLVGPRAEDDIRRAINRYGAEAVREVVAKLAPKKRSRGRPKANDWPELRPILQADAESYLAGRDPFKERTNYAIAKEFADKNPGHSHPSTMRRIQNRLKEQPYDRRWRALALAERMGRENHSHIVS